MAELSSAPVKRLLVEASGGMRVGGTALDHAVAATEDYIRRLALKACEHAKQDKRKTIQESDIDRARMELGGGAGSLPPPTAGH